MKNKDIKSGVFMGLALLLSAGVACQKAKADALNILITPTGTNYYEWTITSLGSNTYSSGWVAIAPTPLTWDSMVTSPGGSTSIGTTQYFSLAANSDLKYTPVAGETFSADSGSWRPNNSGNSEAALIVTSPGTPTSSSTVQNLLVLDGTGGIFLYKTPTLNGSGVVTNTNASGVNAYGYVGNVSGHWNPSVNGSPLNTPITQLGTIPSGLSTDNGSGLEGDLEFNPGFEGTNSAPGSNISAGGQYNVSLPGGPAGLTSFTGYEFSGANQPNSISEYVNGSFGGNNSYYITPTIYVDEGPAVLTPEPASLGMISLGTIGLLLRRKSKR